MVKTAITKTVFYSKNALNWIRWLNLHTYISTRLDHYNFTTSVVTVTETAAET